MMKLRLYKMALSKAKARENTNSSTAKNLTRSVVVVALICFTVIAAFGGTIHKDPIMLILAVGLLIGAVAVDNW